MITRIIGDRSAKRRGQRCALRLLDCARSVIANLINVIMRQRVVGVEPNVLRDREAQAQAAAALSALERGLLELVHVLMEEVEASGEVAVEEPWFRKAQIDLEPFGRAPNLEPQKLTIAKQVALCEADVADNTFVSRIAGAERELAGRLLDQLNVQDDTVWGRA